MPILSELKPTDYQLVLHLFRSARVRHIHLDWRTLDRWLGHPYFISYVMREDDSVQSMIAATLNVPTDINQPESSVEKAAWLRFMLPVQGIISQESSLDDLWEMLRDDLLSRGIRRVGFAVIEQWTLPAITRWGFKPETSVINLERREGDIPELPVSLPTIRDFGRRDIPFVAEVDRLAFGDPLWVYSSEILELAWRRAATSTVIEHNDEIVGYQLSTSHVSSAHLARLAVLPEYQGKGYGGVLVGEMLRFFARRGITTITVNTQGNNTTSQHVYERFGFKVLDYKVPIWVADIG